MKIAVTGKRRLTDSQLAATLEFLNRLASSIDPLELIVQRTYYSALERMARTRLPKVARVAADNRFEADLVLSIGGDGTFLRAARWIGERGYPILGINSGHLGFLADVTLERSEIIIGDIATMNFNIEERELLHVAVGGGNRADVCLPPFPYALNEVAVLRDDTASMIKVDTRLDGEPLAIYQADGLLVATPTGSTGYNLSVGGPILAPSSKCWVVSPVAAHSLTMRPLVVSSGSVVELSVDSRVPVYRVSLDGRSVTVPLDTRLTISRAPFVTRIAHRRGHSFIDTLRSKLLWGIDAR